MSDNLYTVTTKVNVSLEEIADLLCCGLEGGINYWASYKAGYVPTTEELTNYSSGSYKGLPEYTLEHPDYSLIIQDKNTEVEHRLNLKGLKLGLVDMASKFPRHFKEVIEYNCDAETGDVFLQCCVFGDIIYG